MSLLANVYQILQADADVISYVADRIYTPIAPPGAIDPYVIWQPVSNAAYNTLSCAPDADQQRHQIDIYAESPVTVRQVTQAVRNRIQQYGNVISGPVPAKWDDSTTLYRWTMDVSLYHDREAA